MFNPLTQAEVIKALGIPRQSFDQIRKLMIENGDARDIAENGSKARYVFDGSTVWRYREYLEKRAVLIEMNHPVWHSKRKHSLDDVYNLVDAGVFDGDIDHPAFEVATNPGRTPRSLAGLEDAIKSVLQNLPDASELVAEPVIWYCNRCGSWHWEQILVSVWGDDFGTVEGATPLSIETIDGRPMQHRKGCPNQ